MTTAATHIEVEAAVRYWEDASVNGKPEDNDDPTVPLRNDKCWSPRIRLADGVVEGWPFGDMRPLSYGALLVDPPWHFANFSGKGTGKNPTAHYQCMSLADIAALPVGHLAAPDCALFMWATAPMLPQALEVLAAWGFTFKSAGAWAKQSSTGAKWAFGTGYVFRSAAEFLLVGTIGQPRVRSRRVRNLIVAPIREHSRKPDDQYTMVEQLYAGPYAEIFSRTNRPGWDSWGNEAGKFDGGIA